MPCECLDVVDGHKLVEPQREHRQRQGRRNQRLDLSADHGLILAEAGIDQKRCVALGQQVAVRHRIAARAARIGADPPVERKRILQSVKFALGKREYASTKASRITRCRRSVLYRRGHGLELSRPRPRMEQATGCASLASNLGNRERQPGCSPRGT